VVTTNADGSYDYYYNSPVQFYGVTYASYDDVYSSANIHTSRLFYDQSGTVQASEVYGANGSFVDTIGGSVVLRDTINADGSYDIRSYTSLSFYGVSYASYDDQYTADNVRTARTFFDSNGTAQAVETFGENGAYSDAIGGAVYFTFAPASDGSYDNIYYILGNFQGLAYAAYDNHYTASGFRDKISYTDASGNFVGYQSYKPAGGYSVTVGGVLQLDETVNADGSYDYHYYTSTPFYGLTYASYDDQYSSAGVRTSRTFFDASGVAQASETLSGAANYTDYIGGVEYFSYILNADGSYDNHFFAGITLYGTNYASYDDTYSSVGSQLSRTFYDGNGVAKAVETYLGGGSYSDTIGGVLWRTHTVHTDRTTDDHYYKQATYGSTNYASYDDNFGSDGTLISRTFYDSAGVAQGSENAQGALGITNADGTTSYNYSFGQGLSPFTTWLTPNTVTGASGLYSSYIQEEAPGNVDPNHLDGIGALWLVAHLSSPVAGAPGALNLSNATINLTIKGENFNPNGAHLYFWICSYLPGTNITQNYYAGLAVTNWAYTGQDLASRITSDWQTISVTLDTNPADWTYAGNNVSGQGDWAARYQPLDLTQTLTNVNATLHLVLVSGSPSQTPTGFLDIAKYSVTTQTPGTPQPSVTQFPQIVSGLENQVITGTVNGDASLGPDHITYALVAGSSQHGTVTLDSTTGQFSFTPDANFYGPTDFSGTASFQYTTSNGVSTDAPQTVDVFVGPVATTPSVYSGNENVEIAQDTTLNFTLFSGTEANGTNPTLATLNFVVVPDSVTNGTLTLDAATGRYSFTPTAGFSGTASFQYYDTDGVRNSTTKTVTITVDPAGVTPNFVSYNDAANQYLAAGNLKSWTYWVVRNADAGDRNAAYTYGLDLVSGNNGVTRNAALGATYLAKAVGLVDDASYQLAMLYIDGTGVTKDYVRARALLNGVASLPIAQYELGVLDNLGFGATKDDISAAAHYLHAAEAGNVDAMYTLGRRYLSGTGVTQSAAAAYFWLETALKHGGGGPGIQQFIQLLQYDAGLAAAQLTTAQLAVADQNVASWSPGLPTPYEAPNAYSYTYTSAGTFAGQSYASYTNVYTAAGVRNAQIFYDASGTEIGEYDFLGGGSFNTIVGGILTQNYSVSTGGGYSYQYYLPVNFDGGHYASYGDQYNSSNVRTGRTFYDANGTAQASESFGAGGAFTDTIGGKLYQAYTPSSGGSYDYQYFLSGVFQGVSYASYDNHYTAAGFRDKQSFFDVTGNLLGFQSFTVGAGYSVTLGGKLMLTETINADGTYDYHYYTATAFHGVSYASYDDVYNSSNVRTSRTFYDTSGTAQATQTYLGGGSYADAVGGIGVVTEVVNLDGTYDFHYYVPVNFHGVEYASYDDQYSSSNIRTGRTFYDSLGTAQATQTYLGGGSYSDVVGGAPVVTKIINTDGSYDYHYFAPVSFHGVAYASYDDQYNSANVRTGRTFYDSAGVAQATQTYLGGGSYTDVVGGVTLVTEMINISGSYDYHYFTPLKFNGVIYASYDDQYSSANVRTGRTFYDAAGVAQASETYLTGGGFSDSVGGALVQTFTPASDGSYDYHYYLTGSFQGLSYASYDNHYNTAGFRDKQSYYDTSGSLLGYQNFVQSGGYSVIVGGVLTLAETVNADSSYDYHYYVPVAFQGVTYASYDDQYSSANVRTVRSYYDANGTALASETYSANGVTTDKVGGVTVFVKTLFADGSYVNDTPNMTGGSYTEELDVYSNSNVRLDQTLTLTNGSLSTRLFSSSLELDMGSGVETLVSGTNQYQVGQGTRGTVDLTSATDVTLAFKAGFGLQTVTGFIAAGAGFDHLNFDHNIFADWAHLLGATQQVGSDLVITLDPTDSLTLKNTSLAAFQSSDVHFV
jgi:hypothetical protein